MTDPTRGLEHEMFRVQEEMLYPGSEVSPKERRDISKVAELAILPINESYLSPSEVCQIKASFENRFTNKWLGSFRSWLSQQKWNPWNSLKLQQQLQEIQNQKISQCFDKAELEKIYDSMTHSPSVRKDVEARIQLVEAHDVSNIFRVLQQRYNRAIEPLRASMVSGDIHAVAGLNKEKDRVRIAQQSLFECQKEVDQCSARAQKFIEASNIFGVSITEKSTISYLKNSFEHVKNKIVELCASSDPDTAEKIKEVLSEVETIRQKLPEALASFQSQVRSDIDKAVQKREQEQESIRSSMLILSDEVSAVLERSQQQLQEAKDTFSKAYTKEAAHVLEQAFLQYQTELDKIKLLLGMQEEVVRTKVGEVSGTIEKINDLVSSVLLGRAPLTSVVGEHTFTKNPDLHLFISEKAQFFLEDQADSLGRGTYKDVFGGIDLVSGEELALLHYRTKPSKAVEVKPRELSVEASSRNKADSGSVPSEDEAEEAEAAESGSMVVSSLEIHSTASSDHPVYMKQVSETLANKPTFDHETYTPEVGTEEQRTLGAELVPLSGYTREVRVIEALKDLPGIARTLHVQHIVKEKLQDSETFLVQMKYQDDLEGVKHDGTVQTGLYATPSDTPLEKEEKKLRRMKMMQDAIQGLRSMHEKGLIHRDVKPANIMFRNTSRGQPEGALSDFGEVCSQFNDSAKKNCQGTSLLLSPEVACLDKNPSESEYVTTKADIWSMGLTLLLVLGEYDAEEGPMECQGNVQLLGGFFKESLPYMDIKTPDRIVEEMATLNPFLNSPVSEKARARFKAKLVTLEGAAGMKPDPDRLVTNLVCRCLKLDPAERPTAERLFTDMESIIQKQRERIEQMKSTSIS